MFGQTSTTILKGFNNKHNLNVNFIDFHGLINAVPREWKQTILNSTPFEDVNNKYIYFLKSIEKPTKYFYRILIERIAEKPLKSQNKWKLFLGKEVSEEEWENVYSSTFYLLNVKGNNKITELRTILQRESQNS
jgi:hypothetical protein